MLDLTPYDFFNFRLKMDKNAGLIPCDFSKFRLKMDKNAGLTPCDFFNLMPKMDKVQPFCPFWANKCIKINLSILGLKLKKSQGVSPAFLSNFDKELKKSQGVSPAFLSILGIFLKF